VSQPEKDKKAEESDPAAAQGKVADPNPPVRGAPQWRIMLAHVMDFFTTFFGFGFILAALTGGIDEGGFKLEGVPAFLCFGLIAAYFWIGTNYLGGTIWQRILRTRR
jgi:hypothetical protein